ncbi:MAG: hypothetical protein R2715_25355 [Ilumatobacteraceae bacterium]
MTAVPSCAAAGDAAITKAMNELTTAAAASWVIAVVRVEGCMGRFLLRSMEVAGWLGAEGFIGSAH